MVGQLVVGYRKRFHQPRNIFLGPDVARVKQEWIVDLIALQHALALALLGLRTGGARIGGMAMLGEFGIGRVVNQADPLRWYSEIVLYVASGRGRNGNHAIGPLQAPLEAPAVKIGTDARLLRV